jgi:hypothetical protein
VLRLLCPGMQGLLCGLPYFSRLFGHPEDMDQNLGLPERLRYSTHVLPRGFFPHILCVRKGADAKSYMTKIFCLKDDEKGSFQETFIFNVFLKMTKMFYRGGNITKFPLIMTQIFSFKGIFTFFSP